MIKRAKNEITVTPEEYFESWAFEIGAQYWSILGISRNKWIDQAKTKPLREKRENELISQGISPKIAQKQATKEIKIMRHGWAKFTIDDLDFMEGYIFNHKSLNIKIQILSNQDKSITFATFNKSKNKYESIESMHLNGLVEYLKSGKKLKFIPVEPKTLPESDFKYLLINHLGDTK